MEWCVRYFNSDEEVHLDEGTSYAVFDVKRVQLEQIDGRLRATMLVGTPQCWPDN